MNNDILLWMYRKMTTTRQYEEAVFAAYLEGKNPIFNIALGPVPGEMHLANGQEPTAAGVWAHLTGDDFVTASHRSHHVAIAKSVDLKAMTAEIFGKRTGLSGGRGGHMHLFDPKVNFSCSGICGEGIGPAVGAALAYKMRGDPHIAIAFTGEGAANQGQFHESLNLAAVWKLPFILVVEDNHYAISVPKSDSTAVPTNDLRAAAYGIPGIYVAGNDPIAIFDAMAEAVRRARAGEGPTLVELETSRLAGHFAGDVQTYRPKGELAAETADDPIPRMRERLIESGVATEREIETIETEVAAEIAEAFAFARESDLPDLEDAFTTVFA